MSNSAIELAQSLQSPSPSSGPGVTRALSGGQGFGLTPGGKIPAGAYPSFLPYAPVWTSTGTQPGLGNASLTGEYIQFGKLVQGSLSLTMGSTTTFGTGAYILSLPVPTKLGGSTPIGAAFLMDSSAGNDYIVTPIVGGGGVLLLTPTAPAAAVGAAAPFSFAVSDQVAIMFFYQAA